MTLHFDHHLRVFLQHLDDRIEHRVTLRANNGLVKGEVDLLRYLDLLVGDDDKRVLLRAAWSRATLDARDHRALVVEVWDLIAVVVRVGAAIFILEAIRVFRLVDAFGFGFLRVGNPVEVVVVVGAAVRIEVAVDVLGDELAAVLAVDDAVSVGVRIVGAAVEILVAVVFFRLFDALIDGVVVAVTVGIAGLRRRFDFRFVHHEATFGATNRRREVVRRLGVRPRDDEVVLGARKIGLVELERREGRVRACDSEFTRGAAFGSVSLCLGGQLLETFDLATQHRNPRAARRERDDQQRGDHANGPSRP